MRSEGTVGDGADEGRPGARPGDGLARGAARRDAESGPYAFTDRGPDPELLGPGEDIEPHSMIADRYELRRPLGRGGMGVVWEALDTRLNRQVAVKGLLYRGAVDPGTQALWVERARREAQAIARIGHQNVVSVHDVIEADSQVWIVMELLDARSLADLLHEQQLLPVPQAARIGLQVLRGLRAVHDAGVLHRDVKPHNVLFRPNGRALLMDFGIATFEGAVQVTRSHEIIGTPKYLAPELVSPEPGQPGVATPASDLWSLGVTLYEMVEGRTPFTGLTQFEIFIALRESPVPPMKYAGPLGPVIEALLHKDPRRRPTAARTEEMLQAVTTDAPVLYTPPLHPHPDHLAATVRPEPVPSPPDGRAAAPAPRARLRTWRVAVAAALCLGLLSGAGYFAWDRSQGEGGRHVGSAGAEPGPGAVELVPYEKEHPQLKIGVKADQPGLSVRTGPGRYKGYEIDLAYAIADRMGYSRDAVKFITVTTSSRASALNNGDVDLVLATYTINETRIAQDDITFVGPYYKAGRGFLVRTIHEKRFDDTSDLIREKAEVCTAKGSTYQDWLPTQGYTVLSPLPQSYETCLTDLMKSGNKVFAVSTDDVILAGFRKEHEDDVKILGSSTGSEGWGVAMLPVEKDTKTRLDLEVCSALKDIVAGPTWQKLYDDHLHELMNKPAPNRPKITACDTTRPLS